MKYQRVSIRMCVVLCAVALVPVGAWAQHVVDETAEGPWSDVAGTTLTVPKVANGSIAIDGAISAGEYNGFDPVNVVPFDNAWVLGFAQAVDWQGANDNSFAFWLAHDDDNLYLGVKVKDDVVRSNDPNTAFWRDDAIELVVDPFDQNYDVNTDVVGDPANDFGGHHYVNYEGRFSRWDEAAEEKLTGWSNQVDWTWGDSPDDQIQGSGMEVDDGWVLEVRYAKELFENPEMGNKLDEGYKMGFNIGMDDDDGEDLAIQYWWANNLRPLGWNASEAEFYTEKEIADQTYYADYDLAINATGRLTQGGTGHIIFGGLAANPWDCDGDGSLTISDANCAAATSLDDFLSASGFIQGDADGDGEVQFSDFVILAQGFGNAAPYTGGDFDKDGVVQFSDFVILATNFGKASAATVPVPEPATLLPFASLIVSMSVLAGRRRVV